MKKRNPFRLTKDAWAKVCNGIGVRDEKRDSYRGYDIFIGDGFVSRPEITLKRFGVEKGAFPFGCYATTWAIARGEDHIDLGTLIPFDAFHNPELDVKAKRQARINGALRLAKNAIDQRIKHKAEQGSHVYH